MSQPVYTLTPCSYCKRGYRARDMYVVTDAVAEDELLCESCYRKWCKELNEALKEIPYE